MIGETIASKYRVTAMLGRGGMGSVYKAEHTKLGREDALKILHPDLSIDPAFIQRFMREARAMAKLNHENIIRVYDVFEEGGTYCIAMELFDGVALNQYVADQGIIPLSTSLNIVVHAAHGLATAHAQGIVHRDIKPGNIMLNLAGQVKVTDFGIAAAVDEAALTTTGQLVGSPRYMSPEQAKGQPADHRSDLYSLGMVFYEMVTGGTPFNGDSGVVIIGKLAYRTEEIELNFPPGLPNEIHEIIRTLLYRDPDARFQDAAELCNILIGLSKQLNIASHDVTDTVVQKRAGNLIRPEASTQPHAVPPRKKKPAVLAGVSLVVLILVTVGAGFYILNIQDFKLITAEETRVKNQQSATAEQKLVEGINSLEVELDQIQLEVDTILLKADAANAKQLAGAKYQSGDTWVEKSKSEIKRAETYFRQGNLEKSKNVLIVARQYLQDAKHKYQSALDEASQQQIALIGKGYINELQNARESLEREKQQTNIVKGQAMANRAYRKAASYEKEAITLTGLAGELISKQQYEKSEEVVKKAKKAYQIAMQNYQKSALDFEAQITVNKVNTNHSKLRQQQLAIISTKDFAEQANAQEYAQELYQKAIDLNTNLTEESLNLNKLIRKKDYVEANAKLQKALLLAQEVNNAYELAANTANKKVQQQKITALNQIRAAKSKPTINDVEAVEKLLFNFVQAYEAKDLNLLKSISQISDQQLNTVQQIFSQYMTIGVSINSYSLTGDSATADLQIDKLITPEGDEVMPGDNWRNSHLKIFKGRDGWNKISWN